jgi:hypothetical protein
VLRRPSNAQVSIFNVAAFKPGMFEQLVSTSIGRRPVVRGGDEDYFPTKEKPLEVTITLETDTRPLDVRANYTNELVSVGCSCSDLKRKIWAEYQRLAKLFREQNPNIYMTRRVTLTDECAQGIK